MPNTLEDEDWDLLLGRIEDKKCIPFIGAGVSAKKIPVRSQIANEWAKRYRYPMEDSYDLIRVAQFMSVTIDPVKPKEEMCKIIKELLKEVSPSYFVTPDEPHGVLADLSLPIYITTNYDDLMVRALKSRGKTAIKEYCRWKEYLKKHKLTSPELYPTPDEPLVYHLYGCCEIPKSDGSCDKIPESLVLTEDDYLDFFAAISMEQNLLPPGLQAAIADTSLLFLGYRIADWDFHVLCRILAGYLEKGGRKHLSVQFVPGDVSDAQKAQKYLYEYFNEFNINVYWQDCLEFAKELRTRWEARNLELVKSVPSSGNIYQPKPEYKQSIEEINVSSILFLAADPTNESRLRLDEEFREIQEILESSTHRDQFKLELPRLSVRSDDILKALFKSQPYIVHFSGHGTSTGELCIENDVGETETLGTDTLAKLFEQFSGQVNCVILNACYSEIQAKAISKHIKYVIGMNQTIGDEAAIAFAKGFYLALGEGRGIEDAYRCGCLDIQMHKINGHLTPVLITRAQS